MKRKNNFKDNTLLLITLGLCGWGLLNAFIAAVNADLSYQSNRWMIPSIFMVLLFSLAPLAIIFKRHTGKPKWLSALIDHRSFLYCLLTGIAITVLFPPVPEGYEYFATHNLILAGLSLVSCLLLYLFYRREENEAGMSIFTGTWAISIIIVSTLVPQTLELFFPVSRAASLWTAFILGILISAIPMILPIQWGVKTLEEISKLPPWILGLLAISVAATRLLSQVKGGTSWLLQPAFLILLITFILLISFKYSRISKSGTAIEKGSGLHINNNIYWILITIIFVSYSALAFIIGKNGLMHLNNDGIAYYQIARMAAEGQVMFNGYRAPLLSWLIAPFIHFGSSAEIGDRIISGLAGLAWAALSIRLAKNFNLSRSGRLGVGVSTALLALHHTFFPITPDMLGAVLLLGYFIFITEKNLFNRSKWIFIISGVLAALAYYTKYYNLPYVVAHLTITLILYKMRGEKWRKLIGGGVLILGTLSILLAPWIIKLSSEYGGFTYSTGGEVNHAYVGPVGEDENAREGLCVIPGDVLLPAMIHPISCYPAAGWSAFDNLLNFSYQVDLINNNTALWVDLISELGPFFLISLVILGLQVFIHWEDEGKRFNYAWLIISSLLYVAGYLLLFADDIRYYFPILPLIIIAAFMVLEKKLSMVNAHTADPDSKNNALINAIIIGSIALTFPNFGKISLDLTDTSSSCMAEEAPGISQYIEEPFAGITNRYLWNGKHIAYYTQKQTFGYLDQNIPADEIPTLLHEAGVKTLIAPAELDISKELHDNYNFPLIKEVNLCGEDLLLLAVP